MLHKIKNQKGNVDFFEPLYDGLSGSAVKTSVHRWSYGT